MRSRAQGLGERVVEADVEAEAEAAACRTAPLSIGCIRPKGGSGTEGVSGPKGGIRREAEGRPRESGGSGEESEGSRSPPRTHRSRAARACDRIPTRLPAGEECRGLSTSVGLPHEGRGTGDYRRVPLCAIQIGKPVSPSPLRLAPDRLVWAGRAYGRLIREVAWARRALPGRRSERRRAPLKLHELATDSSSCDETTAGSRARCGSGQGTQILWRQAQSHQSCRTWLHHGDDVRDAHMLLSRRTWR